MDIETSAVARSPMVTLPEVTGALLEHWRWIAAVAAVCMLIAVLIAVTATPIYRASTVLIPVNVDRGVASVGAAVGQLGGLASLAGIGLESRDSNTEEALAVLQSREFAERFIRDHALLPRFFAKLWDSAAQKWKVSAPKAPTSAKASKYFLKNVVAVTRDKKTGLVTVDVDWQDPKEAADWANELVERVNAEMRARAVASATASTTFLEEERERTPLVETRAAINRLMEAEIRERMVASVSPEFAFRVVDRALPPDPDDILRPQKMLLVAGGAVLGLAAGCVIVIFYAAITGKLMRRTV